MRLHELVSRLGGTLQSPTAELSPEILDVHLDSRRASSGVLFAALPGTRDDGGRYALDAIARGAAAVLAPRLPAPLEAAGGAARTPLWLHGEARRVAGQAAALVHGEPVRDQRVVGVTGTNGKSTVAHLVAGLLRHAGHRPAVVGTVEVRLWNAE